MRLFLSFYEYFVDSVKSILCLFLVIKTNFVCISDLLALLAEFINLETDRTKIYKLFPTNFQAVF